MAVVRGLVLHQDLEQFIHRGGNALRCEMGHCRHIGHS